MIFYKVCICEALCDITCKKGDTLFVKIWFDLKSTERRSRRSQQLYKVCPF